MRIQKRNLVLLPLVLMVAIGLVRWQIYQRDNPAPTATDMKIRRILKDVPNIQFGAGGEKFSPQQKQTLISHLWLIPTPVEAAYPSPAGNKMEVWFSLPPGQGSITLRPDAAFSFLLITHWAREPLAGEEGPPFITSEEIYPLHPATNRFLRAWLSANAP